MLGDETRIVKLFKQGLEHVEERAGVTRRPFTPAAAGPARDQEMTPTCSVCELHAESTFKIEGMDCREEVAILEAPLQEPRRPRSVLRPT